MKPERNLLDSLIDKCTNAYEYIDELRQQNDELDLVADALRQQVLQYEQSDASQVTANILKLISTGANFELGWNHVTRKWFLAIPTLGVESHGISLLPVLEFAVAQAMYYLKEESTNEL